MHLQRHGLTETSLRLFWVYHQCLFKQIKRSLGLVLVQEANPLGHQALRAGRPRRQIAGLTKHFGCFSPTLLFVTANPQIIEIATRSRVTLQSLFKDGRGLVEALRFQIESPEKRVSIGFCIGLDNRFLQTRNRFGLATFEKQTNRLHDGRRRERAFLHARHAVHHRRLGLQQ